MSSETIVQNAQADLSDDIGGTIQLDNYAGAENFNLFGFKLSQVLDDIILVKYLDCNDNGDEIMKDGVWIPINATSFTWRIGEIVLAGPNCKLTKVGDTVCFPNDKGIRAGNLDIENCGKIKNCCFLNEDRIFGICKPNEE